jgi:hypothetical protein
MPRWFSLSWGCAAAIALTGSAGASVVRSTSLPGAPAAPVYAYACSSTGSCASYSAKGKVIATITQGLSAPMGIATDSLGHVYVASSGNASVVEYARGGGSVLATLQDAGNAPVDVAISQSTSTVAVANASGPSGSATIAVYKNGATTPSSTLTDPSAAKGLGVAFDDAGNCYLLYQTSGTGAVDEFAGCAGSPVATGVAGQINAIGFDGSGNLYYTVQGSGSSDTAVWKCKVLAKCRQYTAAPSTDLTALRFDLSFSRVLLANVSQTELILMPRRHLSPFFSIGGGVLTGLAFAYGPEY